MRINENILTAKCLKAFKCYEVSEMECSQILASIQVAQIGGTPGPPMGNTSSSPREHSGGGGRMFPVATKSFF